MKKPALRPTKKHFTNADLAQLISKLDQKVDDINEDLTTRIDSLVIGQVNLREDLLATEDRLQKQIVKSQDEVIAVVQDVIQQSSAKFDNHEVRITQLEKSATGS